jgi:anaerobic selenocysteine-containing dehydrogenase
MLVDTLPEGMVFMPVSFPLTPVNELFGIALDPRSKTPAFKTCAVKVERI